jgi:hypothetical protein
MDEKEQERSMSLGALTKCLCKRLHAIKMFKRKDPSQNGSAKPLHGSAKRPFDK